VIREPVRKRFMELIELSERLQDAPREVVLDLPPEFRRAVLAGIQI
jgi:hypothetical protein